jgi:hypothetical protein
MLAGVLAWSIEACVALLIQILPASLTLSQTSPALVLLGAILWQTAIVATAAEACKFAAVVLPIWLLLRRYHRLPAQPSTVLLATITVALGFAAQTSLVTLWYKRESIIHVLLTMPMQAIFSAAWGFALGIALSRMPRHLEYSTKLTMHSWLAAWLCHAAWNGLMVLSRSPGHFPLLQPTLSLTPGYLLYFLFAWALWLWWQTERMLRRSQGEAVPKLVTAQTTIRLIGQYVMIFICLSVGGAALNALRDFGDSLQFAWELCLTLDTGVLMGLGREFLRTVILSTIALYIFYRLRQAHSKRQ